MELEEKLLDIDYLRTRLNEIREIKRGEVRYEIERSCNEYSKTIYVYFLTLVGQNQWWRQNKVRISDHVIKTREAGKNFCVKPTQILTKKRKALLMRTFANSINDAIFATTCCTFQKVERKLRKGIDNSEE